MDEYTLRIIKMVIVLIATVVIFLLLLRFRISFGIALFASMAIMAVGIKYVRKDDPEDPGNDE